MKTRFLNSIFDIEPAAWDSLWRTDYPFIQHRFLAALESTACTTAESGWQPSHLIVQQDDLPIAAMPLFIKTHSYGEYVFDWGWADAYRQTGMDYYPKLLCAIPFTPATGPRLGLADNTGNVEEIISFIFSSLKNKVEEIHGSSIHILFPNAENRMHLNTLPLAERYGYQFHWFNNNYSSFDDFLSTFNSRKRKTLRRERSKVAEQNIKIEMKAARELTEKDWEIFYTLYHLTYIKRSGSYGYLTREFFLETAKAFPDQLLLACAYLNGEMVAGALYFRDSKTLYGRYWGTRVELDGLHFEACYYQGIEYAIQNGLQRFDPGAQGEHKIQRGFTPIKTCSYHWLAHPAFNNAVKDFVNKESRHVDAYIKDGRNYLPFKEDIPIVDANHLLGYGG